MLVFLRDLNVKIDGRTHLGHTCAAGARALLRGCSPPRARGLTRRFFVLPARSPLHLACANGHEVAALEILRHTDKLPENVRRAGRASRPRRAR